MLGSVSLSTFAVALAGISVLAMVRIAWSDFRQLEIDPVMLVAAVAPALAAIVLLEGIAALSWSAATGVLAGGTAFIAASIWPGRIGQGDIGLLAALGVIGGPNLLPVLLVLFVVFAAMTCAAYSRARGKRLFRSMFPAALPAMAAAVPVFVVRVASSLWPDSMLGRINESYIRFIIGLW